MGWVGPDLLKISEACQVKGRQYLGLESMAQLTQLESIGVAKSAPFHSTSVLRRSQPRPAAIIDPHVTLPYVPGVCASMGPPRNCCSFGRAKEATQDPISQVR